MAGTRGGLDGRRIVHPFRHGRDGRIGLVDGDGNLEAGGAGGIVEVARNQRRADESGRLPAVQRRVASPCDRGAHELRGGQPAFPTARGASAASHRRTRTGPPVLPPVKGRGMSRRWCVGGGDHGAGATTAGAGGGAAAKSCGTLRDVIGAGGGGARPGNRRRYHGCRGVRTGPVGVQGRRGRGNEMGRGLGRARRGACGARKPHDRAVLGCVLEWGRFGESGRSRGWWRG